MPGLTLVATPLGNLADLSLRAMMMLAQADAIVCEDTRHTRILLQWLGLKKKLLTYHDHSTPKDRDRLVAWLDQGHNLALVSDAGMPLVSDPGYKLVQAVLARGHNVTVVPGPSAGISALVASGLPTDCHHFYGFPPTKKSALTTFLGDICGLQGTLIFYEAPLRIVAFAQVALDVLGNRQVCVARELTKKFESFWRGTLQELAALKEKDLFRGECVILVTGACPGAATPLEALDTPQPWQKELEILLGTHPTKTAVALIVAAYHLPKRTVYQASIALRSQSV